jgi:hypothetical protein
MKIFGKSYWSDRDITDVIFMKYVKEIERIR